MIVVGTVQHSPFQEMLFILRSGLEVLYIPTFLVIIGTGPLLYIRDQWLAKPVRVFYFYF